jgi:glycosyltransferase involved in cell wall biosynthesis
LPKLFGKHCVATIHGLDHQRAKWGKLARTYIMLGEKCAAKFADEIIVLSKGVEQYFQDTYGRKTVFVPNGVTKPESREAQLITEEYGLKKDDYILFLGRLVPEKGISYLIDAFKSVRTDKKLVIAGGSSDTNEFANSLKAQAAGDDRILFTGFVQGRKLEELYSNAYIYTLPSDLEGMPLSLLEAMSYGNCCLVSDIPECAEVVQDKAEAFQKGNMNDLTRKLQGLCDRADRVQGYRNEVQDYICQRFNWDDVTKKTLEIYQ